MGRLQRGQGVNGFVVDAHNPPLVEKLRAQPPVEVDGSLVPIQNIPLQPDAAALHSSRRHPGEKRLADAMATFSAFCVAALLAANGGRFILSGLALGAALNVKLIPVIAIVPMLADEA